MDTEKKSIALTGLIAKESSEDLVREFEYFDGFILKLKHLPRALASSYVDKCKIRKWNRETRQREDALDEPALQKLMVGNHVLGWRGFTVSLLKELVEVNPSAIADLADTDEIKFSPESALQMIQSCNDLEEFVFDNTRSIAGFQRGDLEDEVKNS